MRNPLITLPKKRKKRAPQGSSSLVRGKVREKREYRGSAGLKEREQSMA